VAFAARVAISDMGCDDPMGFSVVVVDASREIGAGVAEELGRRGAPLTLVLRSESALHALALRIKAAVRRLNCFQTQPPNVSVSMASRK
jgi:NAD(P)-dependent dehydrogenase (short-subunit alcohol dehydrogenase family)